MGTLILEVCWNPKLGLYFRAVSLLSEGFLFNNAIFSQFYSTISKSDITSPPLAYKTIFKEGAKNTLVSGGGYPNYHSLLSQM